MTEHGQPQPRNPLRAALERFGRERRGRPQPQSSAAYPVDTTTFFTTEERKAMEFPPEQGQPQQEPAEPWGMLDEMHGLAHPECHGECGVREALRQRGQRQAGAHVHEWRFRPNAIADCACGISALGNEATWYDQGVADAAAEAKER